MSATIPINLDRARVSLHRDGSAVVDDPASPWLLRAWVRPDPTGRHRLTQLRVDVRDGGAGITAARLARLPLAQIVHLAGALHVDSGHPNESYYRLLARPRPPGQRSWDAGHYGRVWQVYRWAEDTGRPGGGVRAVAELWGVAAPSRSKTAYRWVAEARRRAGGGMVSGPNWSCQENDTRRGDGGEGLPSQPTDR